LEPTRVSADRSHRFLAALNRLHGVLRVWRLSDDLQLDGVAFESAGAGYVVREMCWCGEALVFWRIDGISDYLQFDESPRDDHADHILRHSNLAVWRPGLTEVEAVGCHPSPQLLAAAEGGRVAAFGWPSAGGIPCEVYSTDPLALVSRYTVRFDETIDSYGVRPFQPLMWPAPDQPIFGVAVALGDEVRGAPVPGVREYWATIVAIDDTGAGRGVAPHGELRIWPSGDWPIGVSPGEVSSPGIYPRYTPRGIVCSVRKSNYVLPSVAIVSADGVQAEYSLSARWDYGPPELRDRRLSMTYLTSTESGDELLLQEQWQVGMADDAPLAIWRWHLPSGKAALVAEAPRLLSTLDWLGPEDLVVSWEGPVAGEGPAAHVTRDFGILHVPEMP